MDGNLVPWDKYNVWSLSDYGGLKHSYQSQLNIYKYVTDFTSKILSKSLRMTLLD